MLADRFVSDLILGCIVMGIASLVAFLYIARRQRPAMDESEASLRAAGGLSSAELMVRRRRVFLHVYPEWENRDYESDPTSPWHTDLRFRTLHEAEPRAVTVLQIEADEDSDGDAFLLDDGFPLERGNDKLATDS